MHHGASSPDARLGGAPKHRLATAAAIPRNNNVEVFSTDQFPLHWIMGEEHRRAAISPHRIAIRKHLFWSAILTRAPAIESCSSENTPWYFRGLDPTPSSRAR